MSPSKSGEINFFQFLNFKKKLLFVVFSGKRVFSSEKGTGNGLLRFGEEEQLPLRKKARLPPPQRRGVEVGRCGAELTARLPTNFQKKMLCIDRSDSQSKKRNQNTSSVGNSSFCPFPVQVPEWNKKDE
ncbi:hypothetical protein NPIL_481151 [Nephila pilipes]|uniref:Uncharacterized protein n=1 Tax=Nephila pilipes TaxID=299642 RepID=A0A8X6N3K3_NEPPI|nr:hypothetical protein NPIL_481151 [Nephila pilipes]